MQRYQLDSLRYAVGGVKLSMIGALGSRRTGILPSRRIGFQPVSVGYVNHSTALYHTLRGRNQTVNAPGRIASQVRSPAVLSAFQSMGDSSPILPHFRPIPPSAFDLPPLPPSSQATVTHGV